MTDAQLARLDDAMQAVADLDVDSLTDAELHELVIGLLLAKHRLEGAAERLRLRSLHVTTSSPTHLRRERISRRSPGLLQALVAGVVEDRWT